MQIEDNYLKSLLTQIESIVPGSALASVVAPGSARGAEPATPSLLRGAKPVERRAAPARTKGPFFPRLPDSLATANVSESLVESLVFKFLLEQSTSSGRAIVDRIGLPYPIIEPILSRLRAEQMVVYKSANVIGDYTYQLTSQGIDAAQRLVRSCAYCGSAPVSLEDYKHSVEQQSIRGQHIKMAEVKRAFSDLSVGPVLLNQVGQAMDAGKGFFLYGTPGNGKTSIAERVSMAFSHSIWIPRAIGVEGQIIQMFDPCSHLEVPLDDHEAQTVDQRWVHIRRPAIVAGGELTLDRLELTFNAEAGVSEAPLQLKSNCGTLVIDDFGRQRMSTADLLNRWIVPLDRAVDYLRLPSGKTIQVPFDQMLVFSTNLEPSDLVDDAFLRRIPYKIEVVDPDEAEFHGLFQSQAERFKIPYSKPAVDYLIGTHFRPIGRPLRRCHARDLLLQVKHFCQFNDLPLAMTDENFDMAVVNYFALNK